MKNCFVDTETRSRTPIVRGTDLYTRDAACTIVTWAVDEEPALGWDVLDDPRLPAQLEDALSDERVQLIAHQAPFDHNIVRRALKIPTPIERWFCTRACAYAHGLPGSLETLGAVLGLPADKQKLTEDGKLIQKFCVPKADNTFRSPYDFPEEWQRFFHYAIRDTEALREIYRKLPKHNYRGDNFDLWHLDQKINERGFGFDKKLATAVVGFLKTAKARTDEDLTKATGGAVQAATQRARLIKYLNEKLGFEIANLRASEVREMLEHDDLAPEVRFLLETRLEAAKSAASKFGRGLMNVGPGDRMRHTIQYGGAGRTGRFAHRGFQPGNMSRPAIMVYES